MHHFIRRVHAPNEVTANVLFAVAERASSLGKAQRRVVVATLSIELYYLLFDLIKINRWMSRTLLARQGLISLKDLWINIHYSS